MQRPKHVTQPAPHPCALMQRMVVERRDRLPRRSRSPRSAQRSAGKCNSNVQFPIGKQVVGEATCNASAGRNMGWWWNGELSDMRHRKREEDEHTIEVQLPEGTRRRHKSGIAAWRLNQTRQPQLGFICVAKRSGFSVTTERARGDTYVVCLAFPPPYILLVQWKVNGRDLRPSSVFPTSCDSDDGTISTTSIAKRVCLGVYMGVLQCADPYFGEETGFIVK